ncbi:MAG: response regulator transcription factor [Candidatus Omnitrophica bacterium]|nr:response regulator transcription factor [Candidatus Omnitrophota bacterium]
MRILLIEDEVKIASFIKRGLTEENYTVDVANKGEDGLYLAEVHPYDLIILDVMLPDTNGLLICRELRQKKITAPIFMLTARDSVKDKVTGLDAGADDYLTKPFSFEEFLARVRALCRKADRRKGTKLLVADLELDQLTHAVSRAGRQIALTAKEYALLEYLMLHANEVVTRTMIAEHVWNEDFDSFTNVFDVYVYRLRSKIDKGAKKPLLHSVRGVGYLLKEG